ncbi:hypothetical protein OG612_04045 [Streptomyces sp. NBC_01527]|uniref:hypothetical protein n=1 Tax=unclassified Streptomyces TaxID=2593676 RepID=UPI002E0F7DC9|nr:hypothetical protein OG763_39670 [Streptomyces sp. NBC_01230]
MDIATLTTGDGVVLVPLQSSDRIAALRLRYDRVDCATKDRTEMVVAIRRHISKLTGEAQIPVLAEGQADG